MPVDVANLLHVLAHELRSPVGVAQGYLRMLMDDRLIDPADRRRAIEQTEKAVARISEITNESSRLAEWFERPDAQPTMPIDARVLVDRVVSEVSSASMLSARIEVPAAAVAIETSDAGALASAIAAVTRATARELASRTCTFAARVAGTALDIWIGGEQQFAALGTGPAAPAAAPLALERGGLGLSLVFAAAVLEAHGAIAWTANGSRSTVGIRLPIAERAHQ